MTRSVMARLFGLAIVAPLVVPLVALAPSVPSTALASVAGRASRPERLSPGYGSSSLFARARRPPLPAIYPPCHMALVGTPVRGCWGVNGGKRLEGCVRPSDASLASVFVPSAYVDSVFAPSAHVDSAHAPSGYAPTLSGSVQGYRLSGVEPDGDPLYQVVLQTRLSASAGTPAVNLIVSSYLENFKPDTTPVLPDLLHPNQTAHNLGGFLQGKALLTDDAGDVLYIGDFLAEAFLDNTNHAAITLFGSHSYAGGGRLKGMFSIRKSGQLVGSLRGRLTLSLAAQRQIGDHRGVAMRPLQDIIKVVKVVPHYYGAHGVHGSGPALHTGFGGRSQPSSGQARQLSPWTIAAGAGALLSLLLAGALYLIERRRHVRTTSLE